MSIFKDKVRFRTSSGRVGEITSTNSSITISYLETYIDLSIITDVRNIEDRLRAFSAVGSFFNGYHLSGKYGIRVYLDKGEIENITLTSVTAKNLLNLKNAVIISTDTIFSLELERNDDPSEPVTPTDSQDISFITDSGEGISLIDSSGRITATEGLVVGNFVISGDSNDNLFFTNSTDGLTKLTLTRDNAVLGFNVGFNLNSINFQDNVTNLIDDEYIKGVITESYIKGVTDGAYIRQIIDENYIKNIIDSAYINSFN